MCSHFYSKHVRASQLEGTGLRWAAKVNCSLQWKRQVHLPISTRKICLLLEVDIWTASYYKSHYWFHSGFSNTMSHLSTRSELKIIIFCSPVCANDFIPSVAHIMMNWESGIRDLKVHLDNKLLSIRFRRLSTYLELCILHLHNSYAQAENSRYFNLPLKNSFGIM